MQIHSRRAVPVGGRSIHFVNLPGRRCLANLLADVLATLLEDLALRGDKQTLFVAKITASLK